MNNILTNSFWFDKDLYESKYQLPINKRKIADLKDIKDWKAFIGYSNNIDDIYKNIEE